MSPLLMQGDIIFWIPKPLTTVEKDDLIIYKSRASWPDTHLVAHRVINISTKNHQILLTTKGDANRWADQYGPHLPEPYITNENYIGTIISVGPFPLKIPLLGNIGIFFTTAMDTLSQAARTKDAITYLGVFFPLTIALVLFFITLLLLPEKTKTIKEQINYLILREKGINLPKFTTMLLLCFFLLMSCTHVFAYDSFEAEVGINESPHNALFNFGRIQPNQTSFPQTIPLINPGIMPLYGYIYGDQELISMVDIQTFQLDPSHSIHIKLTATAEENTPTGLYKGTINIYSSALWIVLPEPLTKYIIINYPAQSVYLLDFFSAVLLTFISIMMMVLLTFCNYIRITRYTNTTFYPVKISYSHCVLYKIKLVIKKGIKWIFHHIFWVGEIPLHNQYYNTYIPALLITASCIFILNFSFLAVLTAPLITIIVSYLLHVHTRKQVAYLTVISLFGSFSLTFIYNLIGFHVARFTMLSTAQMLTYILGMFSSYFLLVGLILLPMTFGTLMLTRLLQNINEHYDPLLRMEGQSDL